MDIFSLLWQVNYLHVLIASIAWFVFGTLWYSPLLFAQLRSKHSGVSQEAARWWMKQAMIVWFIMIFIWTIIVALLVSWSWLIWWMKLWWLLWLFVGVSMIAWAGYEKKSCEYITMTFWYILLLRILIWWVIGWL